MNNYLQMPETTSASLLHSLTPRRWKGKPAKQSTPCRLVRPRDTCQGKAVVRFAADGRPRFTVPTSANDPRIQRPVPRNGVAFSPPKS
jgi:hypothetical protein